MPTTHTHILRLPTRTVTLKVTESPGAIHFQLSFSRIGDFGDMAAITAWLKPQFERGDGPGITVIIEHKQSRQGVLIVEPAPGGTEDHDAVLDTALVPPAARGGAKADAGVLIPPVAAEVPPAGSKADLQKEERT